MFSSSNSINSIAKNYINNYGDGSNRNIGLAGLVSDLEVADLRKIWDLADIDHDGYINYSEYYMILSYMNGSYDFEASYK